MAGGGRELPLVLRAECYLEARVFVRERLEAGDDRSATGRRLARHEHGVVEQDG